MMNFVLITNLESILSVVTYLKLLELARFYSLTISIAYSPAVLNATITRVFSITLLRENYK